MAWFLLRGVHSDDVAVPPPPVDRRLRSRIPVGKLAYSLEIDSGLPLREGDELDLFITGPGPEAGFFLQGALVLEATVARRPVVALDAEQIRWVEMAKQRGKLRVAVRSAQAPRTARQPHLHGSRPKRVTSPAIQIWEDE